MSRLKHVLGLCGLLGALGIGLSPAHAGENTVAVSGTGTIDPGLPCPPDGCDVDLDFTAVFAGEDASGTASCTFAGHDNFPGGATVVAGSGSGTINCAGGVTATGVVTFSRTGTAVTVGGSITVNGCSADVSVGLVFHPLTTPPVTTFGVHGGGRVHVNCTTHRNAVAVSGTGTINPGLPCPVNGCLIHLDFTAVFAGQDAQGTATCTFDGTDTFPGGATVLAGSGSGTINCSGGVTANGTVTFSRTGTVVDVGGTITVNTLSAQVDVTLVFHPTSTPPVTAFGVHGGGTVTTTS